jgi:hypothetical protein
VLRACVRLLHVVINSTLLVQELVLALMHQHKVVGAQLPKIKLDKVSELAERYIYWTAAREVAGELQHALQQFEQKTGKPLWQQVDRADSANATATATTGGVSPASTVSTTLFKIGMYECCVASCSMCDARARLKLAQRVHTATAPHSTDERSACLLALLTHVHHYCSTHRAQRRQHHHQQQQQLSSAAIRSVLFRSWCLGHPTA